MSTKWLNVIQGPIIFISTMAIFIPVGQTSDFHGSMAEMKVYEALKQLPDNYYVFYSVIWGDEAYSNYHSGEADFMVYDPTRGFLVIEVKGGGIERDLDGNWISIGRDGERHPLKRSPLQQAWESVDKFQRMLGMSQNETVRKYRIIPAVWFPDLDASSITGKFTTDYQQSNTFTKNSLTIPTGTILRAFTSNHMMPFIEEPSNSLIRDVINIFAPTFKVVPSMNISYDDNNLIFHRLTEEQAKILDFLKDQKIARINGVSGTGKTMIALERARRFSKTDNVLFLCFNKLLLEHLKEHYSEEMPNVTFSNLHQLRSALGFEENATEDEITDFLLSEFSDNYQFDHIVIDEGQDFSSDHLDFLLETAKATGGYFYVFYDEKQLVHKWDQKTIEWLNSKINCVMTLPKNCRNTLEIAETAYAPVKIEGVELASRASGDVPCINDYFNKEAALQGIADTIHFYTEEKGFRKDQIVILTLKTLEKSILAGRESVHGYRLTNERGGKGVLFTTARKFKGLESDVIIIVDFDELAFKDDNAKCVFYVASSRAKHCLTYIATLTDYSKNKILEDLGAEGSTLEKVLSVKIAKIR